MTICVITGVTGQDGAYLAEFLLKKGYTVYGTYRRTASTNFWRIEELGIKSHPHFHLVEYDLTDLGSSVRLLEKTQAMEVYNLAAQSFVTVSFENPMTTSHITGFCPLNLLEAIRIVNPKIRFYQAITSEIFGKVQAIQPQTEDISFYPHSSYGVAKLYAHWMTINYRESYDIFGAIGILFNHESPLRGLEFVTRKITDCLARMDLGKIEHHSETIPQAHEFFLELGNLDAKRDWGYSQEYVEDMWRMLQVDKPDSSVLVTGRTETVRDFVRMAFKVVDVQLEFKGKADNETAVVTTVDDSAHTSALSQQRRGLKVGQNVVRVNPKFYRPAEVELLIGSPEKAKCELGWEPKTTLEELCQMMVAADMRHIDKGVSF